MLHRILISCLGYAAGCICGLLFLAIQVRIGFAFRLSLRFQALSFILVAACGWLLLLLPQAALGSKAWIAKKSIKSGAIRGGLFGWLLLEAVFTVLLWPEPLSAGYWVKYLGYRVCAFLTGAVAIWVYLRLLRSADSFSSHQ
jgi:hypothetical protein